jgi:hypothetical protein
VPSIAGGGEAGADLHDDPLRPEQDDVGVEPEDLPAELGQRGLPQQVPPRSPLPAMIGTVVLDRQQDVRVGEVEVVAHAAGDDGVLDGRRGDAAEVQWNQNIDGSSGSPLEAPCSSAAA